VGIGGEYAITDWLSAFLEYRYLDFDTCTNTFADGYGRFLGNVNIRDTKSGLEPQIGRLRKREPWLNTTLVEWR
jgi:hypothetical protein